MMDKREKLNTVKNKGFFVKGDVLLFVVLVALTLVLTAMAFGIRGKVGGTARIYVDNELVKEMDLSQNQRYELTTGDGYNIIVVQNGSVKVEEADCNDHTCVLQGKINRTGQTIICLPHGVKIVVLGKGQGGSDV